MHRPHLGVLVAAAVALPGLAGCSGRDAGDEPALVEDADTTTDTGAELPDDATPSDATEPPTCSDDAACTPFGKVCDPASGGCVACLVNDDCPAPTDRCIGKACQASTPCPSDKACIGANQLCDTVAGVCVDCLLDTDCADGQVCRAGTCILAPMSCKTSKDCSALGQVCDGGGHCVMCGSDLDCAELEHCFQTLCLPDQCHADQTTCADAVTKATCAPNGSGWSAATCSGETSCLEGECVATICTPGAKECQGAGVATCNAQGTAWGAVEPCPQGQGCADGACKPFICQAGASQCNAQGGVDTCAPDGLAWTSAACPATAEGKPQACDPSAGAACKPLACTPGAAFCQGEAAMQCDALGFASSLAADCSKPGPTGGTQICLDGKCVEAKCQAGQKLCADPVTLATCKADGTGWLKTGCPGGEGCEDGACKPIVCTPGASSCSGSAVVQCSAAGTSQSTVVDCATSGQLCKDGTCQKPDCQSGTTQCQGEQLATCKADGSGWTVAACPAEQACIGGACKAKVCTPAALGCQGTAVAKCDATGTGWTTLEDCAGSGKSCLDGACVSQVCQGGTVACVGLNVGTCKSDGSGWVEQACGDGKVCDGGGCVAQACPPGAASCQGAKAYKCDAKGLLQVFVADCASEAKVCSGGVCVAPYCGDGAVDVAGEECDDGNSKDGDGCSSGCKLEGPVFKGYAVWKMTTTKQDDAEMDALMDQACKKYGTAARAATAGEIIARKIVGMPEKNLPESGPGAYLVATRCPDCQGYELSWAKSGFKRRAAPSGKTFPVALTWDYWAQVTGSETPFRAMCVAP